MWISVSFIGYPNDYFDLTIDSCKKDAWEFMKIFQMLLISSFRDFTWLWMFCQNIVWHFEILWPLLSKKYQIEKFFENLLCKLSSFIGQSCIIGLFSEAPIVNIYNLNNSNEISGLFWNGHHERAQYPSVKITTNRTKIII